LLSLLLVASSHAQLTLNRYISGPTTITWDPVDGGFAISTLNWTNNGFTNISGVSVQISLSPVVPDEFWVGGTAAFLDYNQGAVDADVYTYDSGNFSDSMVTNVTLTNSFTSPQVDNEWALTFDNLPDPDQIGAGVLDYWRLIVTGDTVTNGTISVGQQGIISATNAYTVNGATISVVGSGTNGVTVTNSGSLTFNGGLTGSGDLNKVGSGTLFVGGNSTGFTGALRLNAGTVNLTATNALGTGVLIQSNGSSTAIFSAGGTYNENMSLYNASFANGGNTLSGTITNNGTIYNAASGTTNTLSGFQTGSGGITLDGGGTLAVTSATNDHVGNTVISNGTLRITTLANSNTVSSVGRSNNITLAGTLLSTNANAATTAVMDYTGGNVSTDRAFVMTNGGGTINMATAATEMTLTGSASGSGKLIVGQGTLILNGASNAFAPGSIQVDSGATLQLAANNQIGDGTGLILNGGTFRVGTSTTGFSDTLGTLTLSASSTIDLGSWTTGLRQLTFADSSAITWTGTLTITNWQGVAGTSSDVAEIIFGAGGLTSAQRSQVYWANQGIPGANLLGTGELVPVPEPKIYVAALALLGVVGWRERRRIAAIIGLKRSS
jgi:autotransporter-associated beta strand protein